MKHSWAILLCLFATPFPPLAGKLAAGEGARFLRGDANGDCLIEVSDAIFALRSIFLGTSPFPCRDAADADDDGAVDVTDGIFILDYLFLSGAVPPAPGPSVGGFDSTPDDLDCSLGGSCGYFFEDRFDDASSLESYSLAVTSSGCVVGEVIEGTCSIWCPDNIDAALFLKGIILDDGGVYRIEADVFSSEWKDGAPRIGIDLAAEGSVLGIWGPSAGYAFFISDPYDSLQGGRCSQGDRCPSITLSNGAQILDLEDVGASPGLWYHLVVEISPDGLSFEILSAGGLVARLTSTDAAHRILTVGLHCSEARCLFDNLRIGYSPPAGTRAALRRPYGPVDPSG